MVGSNESVLMLCEEKESVQLGKPTHVPLDCPPDSELDG